MQQPLVFIMQLPFNIFIVFKGEHQGRGQALYSSVSFGAGLALGTLVSGYLWENLGSMQIFLFSALMSTGALVVAFIWLRDE